MERRSTCKNILIWLGILILCSIVWIYHRNVPFMMDDIWYGTNLATGGALLGLSDIIEGQVWHYLNWGGRSVTHGILQASIMLGELGADILNMVMLLLLVFMICVVSGRRTSLGFLAGVSLVIAWNANIQTSMFWQAGTVNYVYSTAWILIFIYSYLRHVNNPECSKLPFIAFWILPLGLMTGWSNENMGPACFLFTIAVQVYLVRFAGRKLPGFMIAGSLTCLIGSILVIVAPGNFVRSATMEAKPLGEMIGDRLYSMLCAGTDFLFPSAVLVTVVLLVRMVCLQKNLHPGQWMLLGLAVLSYGAMVLSPHYPDRATFGTMVVCIILVISVTADILQDRPKYKPYVCLAVAGVWCYAIYCLTGGFSG